ncbi:TonB-dependent receptor family protein [Flavobacterium silvaticum]|uniref:TonB-dependent receptor family protein n=1 Tax=Flavobacterium silvaticum TaxID=1852020 RepID=UPI001F24BC6B|nr:TonB-dependent receptor [Flavobacterium silvaticum]
MFLLIGYAVLGQSKISVSFIDASGKTISGVDIFNTETREHFTANASPFEFSVPENRAYEISFYKEGFAIADMTIGPSDKTVEVNLQPIETLSEVLVQKNREKAFALSQLKDIDETAIYAGKKTQAISLDKIVANKSVNNTRQVYSQIAGLTINESSYGGLQLSIGGRGLDPNRTSNFNTRQNGYDISADVLGYPESYYTPPTEGLKEIQLVRGAASLQYGTQFGGLVNFKMNEPSLKKIELTQRNTAASYGLFTNFTSLSGTDGKFSYYTFFNYKQGDGFRPNWNFSSRNIFVNLNYQFTQKTSLHFDYTLFDYLEKQPGGLTDAMFYEDPKQSNRSRNWFQVNWNLLALRLKHKFTDKADFSLQVFGLDASRDALGFRSNRVSDPDDETYGRDLIKGTFKNWGAEARFLQKYNLKENSSALLVGMKYYQAENTSIQGPGSSGSRPDFNFAGAEFPNYRFSSDYSYPNLNLAFFAENIFKLSPKFSITPGIRIEKIRTKSDGSYREVNVDLAGNVIYDVTEHENLVKDRNIFLAGIGFSYKWKPTLETYANISQNYRSVTFSDMRLVAPGLAIDPNITDEKGFSADFGVRGNHNDKISFDASAFALYYDDKIGEYPTHNPNNAALDVRYRSNIGTALTYGVELLGDWKIDKTFFDIPDFSWNYFVNVALTDSKYLKSDDVLVEGNKVEFVPLVNLKTGMGAGYKNFTAALQLTYLSEQFTDARNLPSDKNDNTLGIYGQIPSYYVADLSLSYKWKRFRLEAGINNFTNNSYFTRRATGYPGPGILPSDPRTFYGTLEIRL